MNPLEQFEINKKQRIESFEADKKLNQSSMQFMVDSCFSSYTYNFSWMGVPIIQYPQDMVIMQELICQIKPDLIIETGVAHGGSLVYYSSIMELIGKGRIIGIDIDIRDHNRNVIENHQMYPRISLIEGSSVDERTVAKVKDLILPSDKNIIVCLDSMHTHDHVLSELNLYSEFVTPGSYLVVFDTTAGLFDDEILNEMSKNYKFKPWGKDSNPLTAVQTFIEKNKLFEIDKSFHLKAQITNCYSGFLKRI